MQNNTNEEFVMAGGRIERGTTNWAAVDALTEEQVMAAALADPDAQPLTESDFRQMRRISDLPGETLAEKLRSLADKNKRLVSIRYDPDVLAFFKAQGKGYQTLMNNVLRSYMEQKLTQGQV